MAEIQKKYGHIGTIRVTFSRKRLLSKAMVGRDLPTLEDLIPEKALKGQAVDIGISLGKEEPAKALMTYTGEMIDNSPIAVFIFLYRSKDALQILDILPRAPSPVPLEERDPETLTKEEAVELLRRQKAELEAAKRKIKKEQAEADMQQRGGIKCEAPADDEEDDISVIAPPTKKHRNIPETIELSG
ncbi:hypothetical protein A1O1_06252 [Capronia coronata CBS 617.96]|uniref:DUF7918 domain-containing protein n=1 Tax=Capronia coronata CBS 617.96 TaxID=1182541 RepID=W9Y0A2_9EURO|nr:uncharacterized protein A1O1_06252 [Capronia coronata CBS 617.96]EXJ85883.1 hypothetical protein A1O1_06252 [Capronia coronata CBS 617.96]